LGEAFQPWAILGFVFLTFGTLLYNEIIILPYFGFDQNTKTAVEEREKAEKEDNGYGSFNIKLVGYDATYSKNNSYYKISNDSLTTSTGS